MKRREFIKGLLGIGVALPMSDLLRRLIEGIGGGERTDKPTPAKTGAGSASFEIVVPTPKPYDRWLPVESPYPEPAAEPYPGP